jgi:hypothetical protein
MVANPPLLRLTTHPKVSLWNFVDSLSKPKPERRKICAKFAEPEEPFAVSLVLATSPANQGRIVMKALISTFALALAIAFAGPAFAGDVTKAKNEADCSKAGGVWDAAANKCSAKPQ